MPVSIEVLDSHVKHMTDFYIQRLKTLRDEIIEREKEIKEINSTIQILRKNSNQQNVNPSIKPILIGYSEKWPWMKKVQFALSQSSDPMTTKEIVDLLSQFETSFIYDRKRAVASISSVLSSNWGQHKEFMRVQSESGDFAYTLNKSEKEKAILNDSSIDFNLPF